MSRRQPRHGITRKIQRPRGERPSGALSGRLAEHLGTRPPVRLRSARRSPMWVSCCFRGRRWRQSSATSRTVRHAAAATLRFSARRMLDMPPGSCHANVNVQRRRCNSRRGWTQVFWQKQPTLLQDYAKHIYRNIWSSFRRSAVVHRNDQTIHAYIIEVIRASWPYKYETGWEFSNPALPTSIDRLGWAGRH